MLIKRAEIDGLELSDCVYRGKASFPRHAHQFHSLFIVLGGGVTERSGRLTIDCAPGAIGFIPAGVEHSSLFDDTPAHTLALTIDDNWLRRNSPALIGTPAYRESPGIVSMALRLYRSCHRRDASWRIESEELLVNLMDRLAAAEAARERHRPAWIDQAAEAVRAHFDKPSSRGIRDSGLGIALSSQAISERGTFPQFTRPFTQADSPPQSGPPQSGPPQSGLPQSGLPSSGHQASSDSCSSVPSVSSLGATSVSLRLCGEPSSSAFGATTDALSLGAISEATGRDPAHICRTFRASFGVSITEFTKLLRVRRACVLLRTTSRPITSIALDAGFCDQAHLTRAFRAVLGATPAAYRARHFR